MALRVLILGSGGREHALAWKLAQSALVEQILVCPGNGGTSQVPKTKNIKSPSNDFRDLVQLALAEEVVLTHVVLGFSVLLVYQITLVLPGPEQPLVDGVETYFRKGNLFLHTIRCSSATLQLASRDTGFWSHTACR